MKHVLFAVGALAAIPALAQSLSPADPQPVPIVATVPNPASVATPRTPVVAPPPSVRRKRSLPSPAELRVRAANRRATREPATPGFINALQVYPFSEGVLYRLLAAPERVTDIVLQPGEAIVAVAAGDTARWTVGDTTSGSGEAKRVHIFVKPFAAGLSTNLIIATDRRIYRIQLESTEKVAMAALAWTYPQDELIALKRVTAPPPIDAAAEIPVEHLNFVYTISGDRPAWRPLRVFDDGRQTYLEFPANLAAGEAPPLFVIEEGQPALVNYRLAGRYYVVDRLFDVAELRLGSKRQAVVRIGRNKPGARGKRSEP